MEIPQVPKTIATKKPEDAVKVEPTQARKVSDGGKTALTDTVSLSSRAKLLQHLRAKYEDLPEVRKDRVEDLKRRVEEGTHRLTSEEIVKTILQGTLFQTD